MELTTMDTDKISNLLERIAIALESQTQPKSALGFHDAEGMGNKRFIFVKNEKGHLWYYLKEGSEEQHPIPERCLTGRFTWVEKKVIEKVKRNGEIEIRKKLLVTVEADQTYVLWVGLETNFSKRVLLSLLKLKNSELARPLSLVAIPFNTSDNEPLVLCDLFRPDGTKIELTEQDREFVDCNCLLAMVQERFKQIGNVATAEESPKQIGETEPGDLRISATLPPSPPPVEAIDLGLVMGQIGQEMKRLNWGAEQGKAFLKAHYNGKISRQQLTDKELVDFRDRLRAISSQQLEPIF